MARNDVSSSKPVVLELEPGTYYRCTCGKSAKIPFCDGAHGNIRRGVQATTKLNRKDFGIAYNATAGQWRGADRR